LAPLTLLVGENSTGKTSFQALIRALWDVAFRDAVPYFREEPYDLGIFRDIAYDGGRGKQADSFEAGFEYLGASTRARVIKRTSFHVAFTEKQAVPFPTRRRIDLDGTWLEACVQDNEQYVVRFGTPHDKQDRPARSTTIAWPDDELVPLFFFTPDDRYNAPGEQQNDLESVRQWAVHRFGESRPFASAPVRSRPRRTYDPTRPFRDPEGDYVPTYLASLFHRDRDDWQRLKRALEEFGHNSGLFDDISVKSLGETEGNPFQVQVRKFGGRLKGPQRNLIDVGYGVSQALPLLSELLRVDSPSLFLLQQPEVHLHPKAQAALGSLFCSIASQRRQLIVETHSDYIIDRVRMDIRDKKSDLKPEDVSLLFFEPGELEVKIHSLRFDETGNVLDTPEGYRDFFMTEVRRSIGL
jgi:hypothetical protein